MKEHPEIQPWPMSTVAIVFILCLALVGAVAMMGIVRIDYAISAVKRSVPGQMPGP